MNNLQHIAKDNTRFAMHMAVELCEQGDFDSVTAAFKWLLQERETATLDGETNPDGLPVGLTISEDGSLLNWRGENYVRQSTLSGGKLTAEQVMAIAGKHQPDYCSDTHACFDWQAIADELNAALGGGECEWTLKEKWPNRTGDDHVYGYETGCGARHTWWPDSLLNFCPTCGARVKAVKR